MATGSYIDIDFEADGQNFQRINIDGTDYFFARNGIVRTNFLLFLFMIRREIFCMQGGWFTDRLSRRTTFGA